MNKQLEEAMKHLEDVKENIKPISNSFDLLTESSIEIVLKELERLKEENSKLKRANKTYINSIQSITPVLLEDYIEKDKIREKLQELEKEYRKALEENSIEAFILKCQIEILKELLEGK